MTEHASGSSRRSIVARITATRLRPGEGALVPCDLFPFDRDRASPSPTGSDAVAGGPRVERLWAGAGAASDASTRLL